MKLRYVIGLVTLFASAFASANAGLSFPTHSAATENASIVFPQSQHPVALLGGYTIENGIFRSRTYDCGIDISDLNLTAKLVWDGGVPKLAILGDDLVMCRSAANSPFELDLNLFLNNLPDHVLHRLEMANPVDFNQ
ncbi:hypothetical protein ACODM8_10995 [Vibrio ostreicida]|uniref:Uncharacterized protein n=1 Tax=Vibrio ostreicida TaxID=526588 RepID=A0ABT8BVF8_9VIBR|nr:hypothetical protein [Vibrio ostreicida]MDN3611147.1 hypothetical protein [Vibrio ostreicida]MDN3612266.1 hypothetical protein [Vibrio ostreicida]NPD08650.1 hypothetical protein [Vibrio ostreicida]